MVALKPNYEHLSANFVNHFITEYYTRNIRYMQCGWISILLPDLKFFSLIWIFFWAKRQQPLNFQTVNFFKMQVFVIRLILHLQCSKELLRVNQTEKEEKNFK